MTIETVTVNIKRRGENYVFLSSKDVPGLFLWGEPDKVFSNLAPVIKVLYRENRNTDVDVIEAQVLDTSANVRLAFK